MILRGGETSDWEFLTTGIILEDTPMFIVHSSPFFGEPPFEKPYKAFSLRRDAIAFAEKHTADDAFRADIYEVGDVNDVAKAIAALQMGEGKLVDNRGAKLSDQEKRLRDDREWNLLFLDHAGLKD